MLNAVKSTVPADGGGVTGAAEGYGSVAMASKAKSMSRIDPELLVQLQALNMKREATNVLNATVTMEELGEVSEQKPDPETKKKE